MTKSEELAEIVIDRCREIGISEFVVCAGSRNSPLVLDILSRGDEVRAWSFFEERCAGFFALGRSRALDKPVAIVTTSGTAAAELLPAVIEAHYQGVPILCVTADRPKSFRGTGAPQAIEQLNLYGDYVNASWDVEADFIVAGYDGAGVFWDDSDQFHLWKDWNGGGPAHLNVCFGEPLLSKERPQKRSGIRQNFVEWPKEVAADETLARSATIDGQGLLVVLGSLTPEQQPQVLKFLKCVTPLILADATSGLLYHPQLRERMILGGERILQERLPTEVLRIGGVPSCRFWRDLEKHNDISVTSVLCNDFSGLARESKVVQSLDKIEIRGRSDEAREFVLRRDSYRAEAIEGLMNRYRHSELAVVRCLGEAIPRESTVFLGNSLPIREWNLAAAIHSHNLKFFANRGANGIDGNLSTFLGIAADADVAWGVFGDLTTMYDLAAPAALQQLPNTTKIRIVVINNGGGRIFSRLPVLGDLKSDYKAFTENSHEVRFGTWAEMWGLAYQAVEGDGAIPPELPDRVVIELRSDIIETETFWDEYNKLGA